MRLVAACLDDRQRNAVHLKDIARNGIPSKPLAEPRVERLIRIVHRSPSAEDWKEMFHENRSARFPAPGRHLDQLGEGVVEFVLKLADDMSAFPTYCSASGLLT